MIRCEQCGASIPKEANVVYNDLTNSVFCGWACYDEWLIDNEDHVFEFYTRMNVSEGAVF